MNVGPTQAAALGKFAPKGFISLRDAIEQLGARLVPGWTGDEQVDAKSASVRTERDNWIADQIGQISAEKWGGAFSQAVSDYDASWLSRLRSLAEQPAAARQSHRGAPVGLLGLDAILQRNEREFEKLQAQCGGRSAARKLLTIRVMAKRMLEDARHARAAREPSSGFARGLLEPKASSVPPMINLGSGPEPIELPVEMLGELEVKADKIFQEREQAQETIRQRVVKVWEMLRPELHAGSITCIILKEGKTVAVNPALWATNDAEVLFRECEYDKREILVGEAVLSLAAPMGGKLGRSSEDQAGLSVRAAADAEDSDDHETPKKRLFSQAKVERAYQTRVKNWPADERSPSRLDDASWMKKKFSVSRDKAREIRNKYAPSEWLKPGPPKSGG